MTSATSTRNAVCVSDAMHLHDLVAAAMSYDPTVYPEPWERAGRQAARVASVLMSHIGHMREREIEAMGALLLSQAPSVPLAVTVGRVRCAVHCLTWRRLDVEDAAEQLRLLRLFLSHYDGALRRERK